MARYALVIGIQKYNSPDFGNLDKPAADAEAIAQILEDYGDFVDVHRVPKSWDEQTGKYKVIARSVTTARLSEEIGDFLHNVGDDEALIYFSGHGDRVPDPMGHYDGYLVTSECTASTVRAQGLALESINRSILDPKCRCSSLTLLLDCCHAASAFEESQVLSAFNGLLNSGRTFFFAAACRKYEQAYEGKNHGIFTEVVIKALTTPGIVKTVKLRNELYERLQGSGQEPTCWGADNITLTYAHPLKGSNASPQPEPSGSDSLPTVRGLVPLGAKPRQGPFRAYLDEEKLLYYSRSAHLSIDPPPTGVAIPNEAELIEQLSHSDRLTGLIITGSGGVGKTRLTLELGRSAAQQGWLVYRVKARLNADRLHKFSSNVDAAQKVLILIDYVETQQDFTELIDEIVALNEEDGLHFRYVANCRTTYYPNVRGLGQHQRIDLSPPDGAIEWFVRYREATVRHILQQSDIGSDTYLSLCQDKPILAVFLSYLSSSNRTLDLAELLTEDSFSGWILRRIQRSFEAGRTKNKLEAQEIQRNLAILIAQFPLESQRVDPILQSKQYRPLFENLANDGWIEKYTPPLSSAEQIDNFEAAKFSPSTSTTEEDIQTLSSQSTSIISEGDRQSDYFWTTAHDVFADQILVKYLETIPETGEVFINDLLNFSIKTGNLRSTLYTLQRLVDVPQIGKIEWPTIFSRQLDHDPLAWREVRDVLIHSALLHYSHVINLLEGHETVWEGIESEVAFHNALAWHTRQYLKDMPTAKNTPFNKNRTTTSSQVPKSNTRTVLSSWIHKSALKISKSNYVLTWGLKLCPELIEREALRWIDTHTKQFQTHYLIVSWLESGLSPETIRYAIKRWADEFPTDTHLSFVFQSWLDAGGSPDWIEEELTDWLIAHAQNMDAMFVYRAWLDARGDHSLIEKALLAWLSVYSEITEASFIFNAWLNAGGEPNKMQGSLRQWLSVYKQDVGARYIAMAWIASGGSTEWLKEQIARALNIQTNSEMSNPETSAVEVSYLLQPWLKMGGDLEQVKAPLLHWLSVYTEELEANFLFQAWLNAGGEPSQISHDLLRWFSCHKGAIEAGYLFQAWIDTGNSIEIIEAPLFHWLSVHQSELQTGYIYVAWLHQDKENELVRATFFDWIVDHAAEFDTRFVYQAWLEQTNAPQIIQSELVQWLAAHGNHFEAQFLYKAWLNAGGEHDTIVPALTGWLSVLGTTLEARSVYVSWLKAEGDRELIRAGLRQWLSIYGQEVVAGYLYSLWIRSKDELADIESMVIRWLLEHPTTPEATYVYHSWLQADGSTTQVKGLLTAWLLHCGTHLNARYAYQAWLDADGDPAVIESSVLNWLENHGIEKEAEEVYQPWLYKKSGAKVIESYFSQWMLHHADGRKARCLYQPWLDNDGDETVIHDAVSRWLAVHGTTEEARYIYQPWLYHGADFDVIQASLLQWLSIYATLDEASYIYKPWMDRGRELEIIQEPLSRWLHAHGDSEEAQNVCRAWLQQKGDPSTVATVFPRWLAEHKEDKALGDLSKLWLERGGALSVVEEALIQWFPLYATNTATGAIYRTWLKVGGSKAAIRDCIPLWLAANPQSTKAGTALAKAWIAADGDLELLE
ncbi:MAG: caspase family protein [Cyanobacteria bacterium J06634_6]